MTNLKLTIAFAAAMVLIVGWLSPACIEYQ